MASSDGTAAQSSASRSAGTRSRQAGRRGRAALRSLSRLPSSLVLLAGLLAGFAAFELLRAAQQTESGDALADWAGACARLEEAYGMDAAGENSLPVPLLPCPAVSPSPRLSQRSLRPPPGPLPPFSVSSLTRPQRTPSSRGSPRRTRKPEPSRSRRICTHQPACLPYRHRLSPRLKRKAREARPPRS